MQNQEKLISKGLETIMDFQVAMEMDKLVEDLESDIKFIKDAEPLAITFNNQGKNSKKNKYIPVKLKAPLKNNNENIKKKTSNTSSSSGTSRASSKSPQRPKIWNSSDRNTPKSAPVVKRPAPVVTRPTSALSGMSTSKVSQNSKNSRNSIKKSEKQNFNQPILNLLAKTLGKPNSAAINASGPGASATTTSLKSLTSSKPAPSNKMLKSPSSVTSNISKKSVIPINFQPPSKRYTTDMDLLASLRQTVDRAVREKRTFTVCGNYYTIRRTLMSRGWVEKVHLSYNLPDRQNLRALEAKSINELLPLANCKQNGHQVKMMIMSKLMGKHQVDLYWDSSYDAYKVNSDNVKFTLINTIRRGMLSYASKQGLCEAMKRAHWFQRPGVSYIRHPRSYSLTNNGDPDQFIKDFKLTATMSLIKWIVLTKENQYSKLISSAGKVPISVFHFAINECTKFIQKCKHEDIDCVLEEPLDFQWNEFLEYYYKIVHIGNHFKNTHLENEETLSHKSKLMLKKLKKYWPHLYMDGIMNIWILKPVNGSRGIGIHICRTLQYVLKVITENKNHRYVIQKYIEKPLLIFNTKFDIRQWFLISSTVPLTIWIYKLCYLRFSSQTYNLRKLHESIHLTNNSVQARYKNCNRDPGLPEYNMWDSTQFQQYLENIGQPTIYNNTIYPGLKQCITAAVLLNQEYVGVRKNSFELYGADFMLTEDFKPWLIEINSRPALYPSTPVTQKLCPAVLEDVIKVVVDNARNPIAKTGNFELLYKQKIPPLPQCDENSLKLEGKPLAPSYFYTPLEKVVDLTNKPSSGIININNTNHYMTYVRKEMKKTLEKLLGIIRIERQRRKKLQNIGNDKNAFKEKQKEMTQAAKNIDKGVECVLEIQEIFKQGKEDKALPTKNEVQNSSTQVDELKDLKSVCSMTSGDLKFETESIKQTLVKITQTVDNNSILSDVLKLLRLK